MGFFGGLGRGMRGRFGVRVLALTALVVGVSAWPAGALDGTGSVLGGVEVRASEQIESVALSPHLGLSLSADVASVVPGDRPRFSARLENTGAVLRVSGTLTAKEAGTLAAEVAAVQDYVQYYSSSQGRWVSLAGVAAARSGYTPLVAAPVTSGLVLGLTARPASGVTYGAANGVGTKVASGAQAAWGFTATVELTPSQIRTLRSSDVSSVRNVARFEMTAQSGSGADGQSRQQAFTKMLSSQSPDVAPATVDVSRPDGSSAHFDQTTDAGLSRLGTGDAVTVTSAWTAPALAARGAGESDAAYLARLTAADGQAQVASAAAHGTTTGPSSAAAPTTTDLVLDTTADALGDNATVQSLLDQLTAHEPTPVAGGPQDTSAPGAAASVTRRVPIAEVTKTGPSTGLPGEALSYRIGLHNSGGATARLTSVTDQVDGRGVESVGDAPAALAPGADGSATAQATADDDADPSTFADTAAATWTDTNGNAYGPLTARAATEIQPGIAVTNAPRSVGVAPRLETTLAAAPSVAAPGQPVTLTAAVSNTGARLTDEQALSVQNTGAVPAHVAAYTLLLERHDAQTGIWVPVGVRRVAEPGYNALDAAVAGPSLAVAATGQSAGGVQYPSSGEGLLGTTLAAGSQASWALSMSIDLDAQQIRALLDSGQTTGLRAAVHIELADGDAHRVAAQTKRSDLSADLATQSGDARDARLTIVGLDGSSHTVASDTVAALGRLHPGDHVETTLSTSIAVPAARGASESALDYLNRLSDLDASGVRSTVRADATSTGASTRSGAGAPAAGADTPVSSEQTTTTVTQRVPVLSLTDVGPASSRAGRTITFTQTLENSGSTGASAVALSDHVDADADAAVAGAPGSVAAGATATNTHDVAIAADRPAGALTHTATVRWQDAEGNQYGPVSDVSTTDIVVADPPAAPPLDPTRITPLSEATSFLYDSTDAVQPGVAPGTIDATRAAVLRATVTTRNGDPLAGATVSVLNHPEYGHTVSRADGSVYLAVNGGGPLTVVFHLAGYLDAQRTVKAATQDYTYVGDVALVPYDLQSNPIDLGVLSPVQVARGSQMTDGSGNRRATLIFQPGTTATLSMPDGSSQPINHLTVRITEFTVGSRGPQAMPGTLPVGTAYTYANDFSADEATAAGARGVVFSQPVAGYLENFIGMPVGSVVPSGYYNQQLGAWLPETNGRVVKVLSITAGKADLDLTGSGQAATAAQYAALGITDAERQQLATLYQPGQQLWRVPVAHFSDWNNPIGFPSDATSPPLHPGPGDGPDAGGGGTTNAGGAPCSAASCGKPGPCTEDGGSTIECETQTLHEDAGIPGTGLHLDYSSDRQQGRSDNRRLSMQISDQVPASLRGIAVAVDVAGQHREFSYPATSNQRFEYTWDGKDAFGRTVQGSMPATVTVTYKYDGVYRGGPPQDTTTFGSAGRPAFNSTANLSLNIVGRDSATVSRTIHTTLGGWDERRAGLAGWSLSAHHVYDPTSRTLYLGDGSKQAAVAVNNTLTAFAGTAGLGGYSGDGGKATDATFPTPQGIAVGPDGSTYVSDYSSHAVRRIAPDGTITRFAGTAGSSGFSGDGGPATQAKLTSPYGLAVAPDGSVYVADSRNYRVRRIAPDGTITTVAGNGQRSTSNSQGVPATTVPIGEPHGLAVAGDGTLYIADAATRRILRVTPDGRIYAFAGCGAAGNGICVSPYGPDAQNAIIPAPEMLAVAPDGDVYFSYMTTSGNGDVDRVHNGVVEEVAGKFSTSAFDSRTEAPARDVAMVPRGIGFGPDGRLYIADGTNHMVRRLDPDGMLRTVAGRPTTNSTSWDYGGPATDARLAYPMDVAFTATGAMLVVDWGADDVVRVGSPWTGFTGSDIALASADGRAVYQFDRYGRHLRTVDTLTGKAIWTFGYDSHGRLASLTDLDGDTTTIQRSATGVPRAFLAPFGQRTAVDVDANGYLSGLTDSANHALHAAYDAGGLMQSLTSPNGHTASMSYDATGRLSDDTDAAGATKHYARSEFADGWQVTTTTDSGRAKTNRIERLSDGSTKLTRTAYDGTTTTVTTTPAGQTTTVAPDGTRTVSQRREDPRFGSGAPYASTQTLTTPGGATLSQTAARAFTSSIADDPLSLTSLTATSTVAGRTTTSTYTKATRTSTVTTPAGRTTTTTYDASGRPTALHVPGVTDTTYAYDDHGRLTAAAQGARTTGYTYDDRGNLASATDALGRTTSFAYDSADRLVSQTDPDGQQVLFAYDADGNVTQITPPARSAHTFDYTEIDQQRSRTAPPAGGAGGSETVAYNHDRQPTVLTRPDGQHVTNVYNTSGQLTQTQQTTGGTTTYAYDAAGRLSSATSPDGATQTLTRDGPLVTRLAQSGPVAGTVDYSYDSALRPAGETVAGTSAIGFSYDADDLLTAAGALGLTRDPANGRLTATALGNLTESLSYTPDGDLSGLHVQTPGQTVYDVSYQRDALGRLSSATELIDGVAHTRAYTYDQAGRLSTVTQDGQPPVAYGYDANGNRTSTTTGTNLPVTATVDGQDRLLSQGDESFTYTANGEIATRTRAGQTTTYRYSSDGTMTGATLPDGTHVDYTLDAQGRRVARTRAGTVTDRYLYAEALSPIATLDAQGNVLERFVYATNPVVPDYLIKNGTTYALLTDQLGSVRAVVNAQTGQAVQELDYSPTGETTRDTNPGFQPFGYAGGTTDPDTHLIHYGAREYDPALGRWTSKDPLGFGGGDTNHYAYAGGDPINNVDPTGESLISRLKDVGSAAPAQALRAARAAERGLAEGLGCRTRLLTTLPTFSPALTAGRALKKLADDYSVDISGFSFPGGEGFSVGAVLGGGFPYVHPHLGFGAGLGLGVSATFSHSAPTRGVGIGASGCLLLVCGDSSVGFRPGSADGIESSHSWGGGIGLGGGATYEVRF